MKGLEQLKADERALAKRRRPVASKRRTGPKVATKTAKDISQLLIELDDRWRAFAVDAVRAVHEYSQVAMDGTTTIQDIRRRASRKHSSLWGDLDELGGTSKRDPISPPRPARKTKATPPGQRVADLVIELDSRWCEFALDVMQTIQSFARMSTRTAMVDVRDRAIKCFWRLQRELDKLAGQLEMFA